MINCAKYREYIEYDVDYRSSLLAKGDLKKKGEIAGVIRAAIICFAEHINDAEAKQEYIKNKDSKNA